MKPKPMPGAIQRAAERDGDVDEATARYEAELAANKSEMKEAQ